MNTSMPVVPTRKQARHFDRETRLHQTLMAVMDTQPARTSEVARHMNMNRVTVYGYLRTLEAAGRIRRVMRFYWQT